MKIIVYLLLIVTLQSCLSVKTIERNCDLFAKVCGSGTTTEIKYRDTIIYRDRDVVIPLPLDTAEATGDVSITPSGAQMNTVESRSGIVTIKASVIDSKFSALGYINQDSIIANIRDSILLKNAVRESASQTTATVRIRFIPAFYKFTFYFFVAFVLCFLVFAGLKIRKLSH